MNMEEVLRLIVPDQEEKEEALKKYGEVSDYIEKRFGRETILVGSVAKDTFLKGDKDLDIFVYFNIDEKREEMEKEALLIGKSVFEHFGNEYQVEYAEHPYVSGIVDGYDIEIVPCYKIKNAHNIISAVDRTPFHLSFVKDHLRDCQKDDVRLLKKFLKAQKMYGADSKVNGFSGYLCELLIIHYGSFEGLARSAINWEVGETIEFLRPVNVFKDPLIIIDPVDPNRNVASPVSLDTYSRFVLECKRYFDTKDEGMFAGPEMGYEPIEGGRLIVIQVDMDVLEDIFYSQCRKFLATIKRSFKSEGFTLYRSGIFSKGLVLDIETGDLPTIKKHMGPRIGNVENMQRFLSKNRCVFAEGGHLFSFRERRYNDVIDVINDIIKDKVGMGNHLKKANLKILSKESAYLSIKDEIIYY
ncbi:MAG TPA: CCA tRNA nucleotidyltransferase [Candidatus Methanofastidiosa archaeon]|nr:CCA tRNA nucleotidyltransferase [Candidatus Methanofastidiosa archaeon]